jgi:hypothetical protein
MIKREFPRHETFLPPFKAINDAIINLATNFVLSPIFQGNDENLDVSLSVPQYSNNGQQQSVNPTYHEMTDQVNTHKYSGEIA